MNEFNEENRLENMKDNEWSEIDSSEVNSDEQEESIWSEINWNDDETGEQEESVWNEIDWEESESEKQTESDSNDEEGDLGPEQLDPNEGEEIYEGNDYDQYEKESDYESDYDPYEYGDKFEQEDYPGGFYENSYAESMNTILLSENQIYEYLQEYVELLGEKENEVKQGEHAEVDNSKEKIEEVSELEKFLEEERERIRLEQQQTDLDRENETESNHEPVANEEKIEQEQKEEIEIQEKISEEAVSRNEEIVENREMEVEEDLQSTPPNESVESDEVEEIEEKEEEPELNGNEEKIDNLDLDGKKNEEYEQHQTETQIEDKDEIEIELTVHDEALEIIKEKYKEKEDCEEFIKEGELSQNSPGLEVNNEIKSTEIEVLSIEQVEEELEREVNSLYREEGKRGKEEFKDPQQELEEILEQNRKIEQQALLKTKKKEDNSTIFSNKNYERAKELYSKETGKRPIYANRETKGFIEWLEQTNESSEKLKGETPDEQKMEQEKEEEWINFLKNWIKEESEENINPQTKNQLIQVIEKYNELDDLTKWFQELYEQRWLRHLSQDEKMELKVLIKALQKSEPLNIVLFTNLRAINRYSTHQKLDKAQINQMLNHFFTRFAPIKQLNQILEHKHKSYTTTDLINNLLQIFPEIDDKFKNLSKTKLLENISTIIFSKGKHFLKHILSKIRNSNNPDYNPNYKFSIKVLRIAEENIKNKIGAPRELALRHLENYRYVNKDLKYYYHEQWKKYNPNLKARFFEQLSSTIKTYWFGFLCSDGSITSGNDPSRKRYQISIEISEKDRIHLVKFCRALGLNPAKIGRRTRTLNNKKFPLVYIIFTCKPMFQDLENLGFKEFKKGGELKFPLKNNNLSYALLLGFYDGDGKEGGTTLYSTNYSVLLQIKKAYKIKNEIRKREVDEISDDLEYKIKRTKPIYELSLSANLLNKMMKSHLNSLTRKRKEFSEQLHVMETTKNNVKNPENLEQLIKTHGKEKLAKILGVSFNTLHKLTNEWNVNVKNMTAVEKLKLKIKTKENLKKMIEINGKEKTAKELKTGYNSLLNLMNEWNINTKFITKRELLKNKIGNKENLERLLKNSSLTQLAKKYGVGRNTIKRLYDEWEKEH